MQPKTKLWNKSLKDIKLTKGILVSILVGVVVVIFFYFIFLTPHEISEFPVQEIPISEPIQSVKDIQLKLIPNDPIVAWGALTITCVLNIISFSLGRMEGLMVSMITSIIVIMVFWPLPLSIILIISSMSLIQVLFRNRKYI